MFNFNNKECNSSIQSSINNRIYDRNIPSQMLQPYLSVRPVMTKYSLMPIVSPRATIATPFQQQPQYNTEKVFNPGNTVSPYSGFAASINKESELRNQIFALQKCSQSVYVPNSNSDLYTYSFMPTKTKSMQPFKELFKNEQFDKFNPNVENIGNGLFNNCTRQQLKDLTGVDGCENTNTQKTTKSLTTK
jgi:hypothetical protein